MADGDGGDGGAWDVCRGASASATPWHLSGMYAADELQDKLQAPRNRRQSMEERSGGEAHLKDRLE